MSKTKVFLLLTAFIISLQTFTQNVSQAEETHVPLDDVLSATYNEFSGIAKWKDKILLIPQYPKNTKNKIFALEAASINSVMQNPWKERLTKTEIHLQNLQRIIETVNQAVNDPNGFQGFEAAVVVNNSIFMANETEHSLCFVAKGVMTKHEKNNSWNVVLSNDVMPLPKPDSTFGNAGFESIAYLEGQKKLIAFYENNMLNRPTAYIFDTTLINPPLPVTFKTPLLFRLTDVAFVKTTEGKDSLIGVNHFYNDFKEYNKRPTEFNYYIAGNTKKLLTQGALDTAFKEMHHKGLLTDSYTRLIGITIKNEEAVWKEEKIISYSEDNWEGIIPFNDGVLMVIDGIYPYTPCRLSYFKTNNSFLQ